MTDFLRPLALSSKVHAAVLRKLTADEDGGGYGMTTPDEFRDLNLSPEEITELTGGAPHAKTPDSSQKAKVGLQAPRQSMIVGEGRLAEQDLHSCSHSSHLLVVLMLLDHVVAQRSPNEAYGSRGQQSEC